MDKVDCSTMRTGTLVYIKNVIFLVSFFRECKQLEDIEMIEKKADTFLWLQSLTLNLKLEVSQLGLLLGRAASKSSHELNTLQKKLKSPLALPRYNGRRNSNKPAPKLRPKARGDNYAK